MKRGGRFARSLVAVGALAFGGCSAEEPSASPGGDGGGFDAPATVDAAPEAGTDAASSPGDGGAEGGRQTVQPDASACPDGGCVEVLATGVRATALGVDSSRLYLNDLDDDGGTRLLALPIDGGAPTTLVSNAAGVGRFILHDSNLYCAGLDGTSAVFAVPLSGATPQRLVSDPLSIGLVAVDPAALYFLAADPAFTGTHGALEKLSPFDAGVASTVVTTDPVRPDEGALDPARTTLYFSTRTRGTDDSAILSVPLTGGPATTLVTVTDAQRIRGLTVDATNVYWAIANYADGPPTGGSVWMKPRLGGDPVRLTSWSKAFPVTFALDGGALYVVSTTGGYGDADADVRRVRVTGGSSTVLAPRAGTAVAVGETRVFVADEGAGVIFSIPK